MLALLSVAILSCTPHVIDGDTIRCDGEKIRLLAIDAPELGACKPAGRRCVAGDGHASQRELRRAIEGRTLKIERRGQDRYGRTLANLYVGGRNISCGLIISNHATYVAKWDKGKAVKRDCGL